MYENFTKEPSQRWRRYVVGNAKLEPTGSTLRFVTTDASTKSYSDAQLDDYRILPDQDFPWRPPLRLIVRARFSHPSGVLQGTAGFGFWNYPFLLPEGRMPNLPRVVWFFYASPPSNMKLDLETAGFGWKAATIDALRPSGLLIAPLAPVVIPLMNIRPLYRVLWPRIQQRLHIGEAPIHVDMTGWHVYTIEWGMMSTRFCVDRQPVLENAPSPGGPLCMVMWLDNQYLIVTPNGRFGWGLLDAPERQWLEIDWVAVERGSDTLIAW